MPETLSNHHLPFLKPTQRTLLETYKLGVPFQGVMDIVSVIHQSLYVGEQGCYVVVGVSFQIQHYVGLVLLYLCSEGFSLGCIIFLPPQKQLFQITF